MKFFWRKLPHVKRRESVLRTGLAMIILLTAINTGLKAGTSLMNTHPRLWFNQEAIQNMKAHWNDASGPFVKTRNAIEARAGSSNLHEKATGNGVLYLATGNSTYADRAISAAKSLISNNDVKWHRFASYADPVALVFDWCYDQLSSSEKSHFVSSLNSRARSAEAEMLKWFRFHERWNYRMSFASMGLAIQNEPGAENWLPKVTKMIDDISLVMDEEGIDGAHTSYPYQYRYQILAHFMYDMATGSSKSAETGYVKNGVSYLAHKLGKNGFNFKYSEGDVSAWHDQGYIADDINPGAGYFFMMASYFNNPVAQWIGKNIYEHDNDFYYIYNDPHWLMYAYYDAGIAAKSPSEAGMSKDKFFRKTGMVNFRDGFNYGSNAKDDISIWLYNTPTGDHSRRSQNHFEIWRGEEDLAIRGANYMGRPSEWKKYFDESYVRNTMGFVPAGSSKPDLEGGQNSEKYSNTMDSKYYPASSELNHYKITRYRGHFSHYESNEDYAIAVSDASYAYGQVNYYVRDFIYLRPGILLVNDRYETKSSKNIETLRWYYHSRRKPDFSKNEQVLEGSSTAGKVKVDQENHFSVTKYNSKIEVDLLSHSSATVRAHGGGKYTNLMDGRFYDPEQDCQSWMIGTKHVEYRKEYIDGQWTSYFEFPNDNQGNIVIGMWVGDKNDTNKPTYQTTQLANGTEIKIAYNNKDYTVFLPSDFNGQPTVTLDQNNEPAPVPVPDAPVLSADNVTESSVSLSWKSVSDATGYLLESSTDNSNYSKLTEVDSKITSHTNSGLTDNKTYYYRVFALNSSGKSASSNVINETTLKAADPIPAQPALSMGSVTTSSVDLSWNPVAYTETYTLERSSGNGSFELITEVDASTNSYSDKNLEDGTTYFYRLYAANNSGTSSSSNTLEAVTEKIIIDDPEPVEENYLSDRIAFYEFDENSGDIVYDKSKYGKPIDLIIGDVDAVNWDASRGLALTNPTILKAAGNNEKITEACQSTNEITVEAWVKAANLSQDGPARIVTFSTNARYRAFTLGQGSGFEESDNEYFYTVRLNKHAEYPNGTPPMEQSQRYTNTELHHIVYTRANNGEENLYINGELIETGNDGGDFSNWDRPYELALGDELNGSRSWLGDYYKVAIYKKALSYDQVDELYFTEREEILDVANEKKSSDNITSIPENDAVNFSVYPIPSDGNMNIQITEQSQNSIEISIMDITGKVIYSKVYQNNYTNEAKNIQLENVKTGVYLLNVRIDGRSSTKRIMIK